MFRFWFIRRMVSLYIFFRLFHPKKYLFFLKILKPETTIFWSQVWIKMFRKVNLNIDGICSRALKCKNMKKAGKFWYISDMPTHATMKNLNSSRKLHAKQQPKNMHNCQKRLFCRELSWNGFLLQTIMFFFFFRK